VEHIAVAHAEGPYIGLPPDTKVGLAWMGPSSSFNKEKKGFYNIGTWMCSKQCSSVDDVVKLFLPRCRRSGQVS
jgi:hypothetical protein